MATKTPIKLVDLGSGQGSLKEFETGDTLPAAVMPNTDSIAEGAANLYFTQARVHSTPLTGLSVTNSAIVATDTMLVALGKTQGQINAKAASGANSDITSLSGLTTALSIAQGGTGANTATQARTNLSCAGIARTTADTSIPNNTLVYLTWGAEVFDSAGIVNLATDTTYLTVPETGVYVVFCSGDLQGVAAAAGSIANLRVAKDTGTIVLLVASAWSTTSNANQMAGTNISLLTAGDKLRVGVFQNSGLTTSLRATTAYSGYFGIARVG